MKAGEDMRAEYDFSKATKNPYVKQKRQITINIDVATIKYFKNLSLQKGIPYQVLINLYLSDCAEKHKQLELSWK